MTVSPYAGAYWGPRQESLDACTDRAVKFVEGLRSLSPSFGSWYRRGRSRRDGLRHRVLPEHDVVLKLLGSGRNRRDSDRSVIDELGYSMGLWNGQEPSVGLSIGCGMYPRTRHVKNAVVINLPRSDEGTDDLTSRSVAIGVMRLLVDCWEPDWATWTSHEWREAQGGDPGEPVLGWMTYLSGERLAGNLPPGVLVEPLARGILITAAEDITGVTRNVLVSTREALGSQLRSP